MCFQIVHEMYQLWMNEFCTISIIKSWNVNFMINMLRLGCIIGERFETIEEYLDVENNILEGNKNWLQILTFLKVEQLWNKFHIEK